jgi:hypothetical protein
VTPKNEAKAIWNTWDNQTRWNFGDSLVLGSYDWMDFFEDKPKPEVKRELIRLSDDFEQS